MQNNQKELFSIILAPTLAAALFAQEVPAHTGTNEWDLGLVTSDADLSPDDQLIAVTSESRQSSRKTSAETIESLELWDYREHKKLASAELASYIWAERGKNPVRFTADGQLLAAADSARVHVLQAASLKPLRVIELALPKGFQINAMETSPIAHVSVIVARREQNRACVLFAYNLDSGDLLFRWAPQEWVCPTSIAWKPDGSQFAVAVSDPSAKSDRLHIFSSIPWAHVRVLEGQVPPILAFSNDHVYAVGGSAFGKGSVFKRHMGMTVFDAHEWKREKKILLPQKDIHDSISFANGRLLADTGTVKTDYDWSDLVGYAFATDAQITVWEGEAQSVMFQSRPLAIRKRWTEVRMRLSRSGKMVLLNPQNPQIFQVP